MESIILSLRPRAALSAFVLCASLSTGCAPPHPAGYDPTAVASGHLPRIEGTATYLGKAVYQISPDPERVKAFLAAICQPKREGTTPRKERPGLREQNMAGSGRHFHILADDTHYAIRVNRSPVSRDPLVAALFGPAPSQTAKERA